MSIFNLVSEIKLGLPNTFNTFFKQLVVALLYLFFGIIIHHYFTSLGVVSIFWPGSGLALAAMLIGGRRYLCGILLGSLVLNGLSNNSIWMVFGITLAHVTEALLAAWLVKRNDKLSTSLYTLSDYLRLIAWGGGVAGLSGAFFGSLSLLLAGYITPANYLTNASHWWMGDVLGVALVSPLILAWRQPSFAPLTAKQKFEKLLLASVTFIAGQIIFLGWFHEYLSNTPKEYMMFFFVSWAAVRLELRWITLIILLIAIQALSGAYQQVGFFAQDIAQSNLHNYWAYILILSMVGMTIAIFISEINQSLDALGLKDSVLNATANSIVITNIDGKIQWANPAFSKMTGFSFEEAYGHKPGELIKSGKQADAYYKRLWETILSKNVWCGELVNQRKDGTLYDEDMTITPIVNTKNEITHFVAVKRDVTERKHAERLMSDSKAFINAILDSVPNEIVVLDSNGVIIAANKSWQHFADENASVPGSHPVHTEIGTNYLEVCHASTGIFSDQAMNAYDGIRGVLDGRLSNFSLEYPCHSPSQQHWFSMSVSPLKFLLNGVVVTHVDITERMLKENKRAEELDIANIELAYQSGEKAKRVEEFHELEELHRITETMANKVSELAFHDTLTELPNRRLLIDRLSQAMSSGQRSKVYGSLMFLDLDNFKSLNDTHGHAAGDLLLIKVARRLEGCMREVDTVARFGGDEFVVMLAELDSDKAISTKQAAIVAEKIRAVLSEPYLFPIISDEQAGVMVEHHCTASVGVSMFIGHEFSQADIMKWADIAMYKAKAAGRNQIRFYED